VLLAYLMLFSYAYPHEDRKVPGWVVRRLSKAPLPMPEPGHNLCRGTLLSREQFLVDVQKWGYSDARLPPFGPMSPREWEIWTNAIKEHWSQDRRRSRAM
jgi:hypothetical protein